VAGPSSEEHISSVFNNIDALAKLAGIDKDKLNTGLSAKLEELKLYKERYEKVEEKLSDYIADDLSKEKNPKIIKELDYDKATLRKIATNVIEKNKHIAIILTNKDNYVIALAGSESNVSAVEFIEEHSKQSKLTFRGGGSRRMAEGRFVR
ncbi:MAG: DHHA1 domain-containing protein, partial [Candidatus Micrarchaeaceae archaeon]